MTSVDMTLLNVDKLEKKIHAMGELAEKRVMQAMVMGMLPVRDEILKSLTAQGKSGTFYFRGKAPNYKVHQASAPGEAPASDTGELRSGISPLIKDQDELTVQIVSRAPYSSALEYGTTKMAARPFMTPAFINNRSYIKQLVKNALKALGLA